MEGNKAIFVRLVPKTAEKPLLDEIRKIAPEATIIQVTPSSTNNTDLVHFRIEFESPASAEALVNRKTIKIEDATYTVEYFRDTTKEQHISQSTSQPTSWLEPSPLNLFVRALPSKYSSAIQKLCEQYDPKVQVNFRASRSPADHRITYLHFSTEEAAYKFREECNGRPIPSTVLEQPAPSEELPKLVIEPIKPRTPHESPVTRVPDHPTQQPIQNSQGCILFISHYNSADMTEAELRQHIERLHVKPPMDISFRQKKPEGGWTAKVVMPTPQDAQIVYDYYNSESGKPIPPPLHFSVKFYKSKQERESEMAAPSVMPPAFQPPPAYPFNYPPMFLPPPYTNYQPNPRSSQRRRPVVGRHPPYPHPNPYMNQLPYDNTNHLPMGQGPNRPGELPPQPAPVPAPVVPQVQPKGGMSEADVLKLSKQPRDVWREPVGEFIYNYAKEQFHANPDKDQIAGRITGMLLEFNFDELKPLLLNPNNLAQNITAAYDLMKQEAGESMKQESH